MRPEFHFTAARGWINDPHGITYAGGRYHHFYQYLPDQLEWGWHCRWAHATSPDMIRFEHRPVALSPGDGDDGIWTGSLVLEGDSATIFYTAVTAGALDAGRVRIATPTDGSWEEWTKGEVVVETPTDPDIAAFRDPVVVREGRRWRMFVGASSEAGQPRVLTYVSEDARQWREDGVALSGSDAAGAGFPVGSMWECPQLFELDGQHVMVTSVMDRGQLLSAIYAVGELAEGRFQPRTWGQLSFGDSYYAPSVFLNAQGHRSLMFWMRNVTDAEQGWIGAHSLPYMLHLVDGELRLEPFDALLAYRAAPRADGVVPGLAADALWRPGGTLEIRSGGHDLARLDVEGVALRLTCGGRLWSLPWNGGEVRVVIDGPVLEVITAAGVVGGPIGPAGGSLEVSADGALQVWPLVTTERTSRDS